jgi:transposase
MKITCGIDWAERHHDYVLMDESGGVVARGRIDTGPVGFAELLLVIQEHAGEAADVPVAIETDKNLVVVACHAAGMTVYPINPRAVARYRERHRQAGGKSDQADALVLADILRTDSHRHRSLPVNSERALQIRALARQQQEAVWARQQVVNRLRSVLLEFYPNALDAFPILHYKASLAILAAAPTPELAKKLTPSRVTTLLRRSGRGNRAGLADKLSNELRKESIRQPAAVEQALGVTVLTLVRIITEAQAAVVALEAALHDAVEQHHQSEVLRSAPGIGPTLAGRILSEIGDDKTRFATAANLRAFSGTAPITRASGRTTYVNARKVRNRRLGDALHWWAFSAINQSPGARAHYDRRRALGDTHNAALRNVANKLVGRLWWCLQNNQHWDEESAWPNQQPAIAA